MTPAPTIDRSAVLKAAWRIARDHAAATAANYPVPFTPRTLFPQALNKAWCEAREAAAAAALAASRAEIRWANLRSDDVRRLQARPVHRVVRRVMVGPAPELHWRGRELWTRVSRLEDVRIDEECLTTLGEHFLDYIGCTGAEYEFDVRREGRLGRQG